MFRIRCVLLIGSIGGFLASAAGAGAQESKPPVVAEKPAGLRIVGHGNSWYSENCEPLCKAAGITGHRKIPNAGTLEKLTPFLEKGEVDAFVLGKTDTGADPKLLSVLLELGPKHNPISVASTSRCRGWCMTREASSPRMNTRKRTWRNCKSRWRIPD